MLHKPTFFIGGPFGFIGDVADGNMPPTVRCPLKAFEISMRIRTLDSMEELMQRNIFVECEGPFTDADPDTEFVTVRWSMFLPPEYVHLILKENSLRPRELWEKLYDKIKKDDKGKKYEAILDWLRAAMTYGGTRGARVHSLKVDVPLLHVMDETLLQHRHAKCTERTSRGHPTTVAQMGFTMANHILWLVSTSASSFLISDRRSYRAC